jgi:hypothetical protein
MLLRDIPNFGPVTASELESIGLSTLEALETLGAEEALRLWVEQFPERINVNAALGLVATLGGTVWTRATPAQRATARRLVDALRAERGLAPSRGQTRRR